INFDLPALAHEHDIMPFTPGDGRPSREDGVVFIAIEENQLAGQFGWVRAADAEMVAGGGLVTVPSPRDDVAGHGTGVVRHAIPKPQVHRVSALKLRQNGPHATAGEVRRAIDLLAAEVVRHRWLRRLKGPTLVFTGQIERDTVLEHCFAAITARV